MNRARARHWLVRLSIASHIAVLGSSIFILALVATGFFASRPIEFPKALTIILLSGIMGRLLAWLGSLIVRRTTGDEATS